jgi:hypothetical protein
MDIEIIIFNKIIAINHKIGLSSLNSKIAPNQD